MLTLAEWVIIYADWYNTELDKSTYTLSIISKLKSDSEYGFLYLTLFRNRHKIIGNGHGKSVFSAVKGLAQYPNFSGGS